MCEFPDFSGLLADIICPFGALNGLKKSREPKETSITGTAELTFWKFSEGQICERQRCYIYTSTMTITTPNTSLEAYWKYLSSGKRKIFKILILG